MFAVIWRQGSPNPSPIECMTGTRFTHSARLDRRSFPAYYRKPPHFVFNESECAGVGHSGRRSGVRERWTGQQALTTSNSPTWPPDYLADYELQGYRTLNSAQGRVANLKAVFGRRQASSIKPAEIRQYRVTRHQQGISAATVNRETSGLSRIYPRPLAHAYILSMAPEGPCRLRRRGRCLSV
jgi:hypothetical protein